MVGLNIIFDNAHALTKAALNWLPHISCKGYWYKKYVVVDLTVKAQRQETLFDDVEAREGAAKTMLVMDSIYSVWGRGTLRSGAACNSKRWAMHSENRSPRYTTHWDELTIAN